MASAILVTTITTGEKESTTTHWCIGDGCATCEALERRVHAESLYPDHCKICKQAERDGVFKP